MPPSFDRRRPRRRPVAFVAAVVAVALLPMAAQTRSVPRAAAATPAGPAAGYWLVASDGGIFAFGDAGFHGSTGAIRLNKPIVGMAPTATGNGYWLVASDGGIFAFGDAGFFGSTGAIRLNQPIVGMAPTATGNGYWLVASDGGIFNFGDAGYHGSGAERGADGRVVAMAPTRTGKGYWQATTAGQVLAFGDAPDLGSTERLNLPIVGLAPTPGGAGYWLVASDGGVFSFGDAGFFGSTGAIRLNQPIVGLAGVAARAAEPQQPAAPGPSTTRPADPAPGDPGPPPARPALSEGETEGVVPRDSPSGGTPTDKLPESDPRCGIPETPEEIVQPADADFIGEASGMVASPRYPGVYWMVRDYGHTAAVNAVRIDPDGIATAREILVKGASNGDWEEISYSIGPDGRGRLWVVESGQMTLRRIYEVIEPDPDRDTVATLVNTYEYAWPDANYNTEASFIHRGRLILVTKTTPNARMYRFSAGLRPGVVNVPTYVGELGNSKDVSLVRQSPDGELLITASHQVVHLYRSTDGSGTLNSFNGRLPDCEAFAFPDGAVEAGEFSAPRAMVFMDERKVVYRLRLSD